MVERDLYSIIRKIVHQETIWLRHYDGKVLNNDGMSNIGPQGQGYIQVAVYELGYDTEDKALWCAPRGNNSIVTPNVGDWVEIYFINGDRNRPVYIGDAMDISGQLPQNYDGAVTTDVIYEDGANQVHIKYDANTNILEIGNTSFQFAARQNDATTSDSSLDSAFWTWLTTTLVTWANTHIHSGVTTGAGVSGPVGTPLGAAPTSLTGKINAGSTQIKIGG